MPLPSCWHPNWALASFLVPDEVYVRKARRPVPAPRLAYARDGLPTCTSSHRATALTR